MLPAKKNYLLRLLGEATARIFTTKAEASNPHADPPSLALTLSNRSGDIQVLGAAIQNPNITPEGWAHGLAARFEALAHLAVQNPSIDLWLLEDPSLFHEDFVADSKLSSFNLLIGLIRSVPNYLTSDLFWIQAATHPHPLVRLNAAESQYTPKPIRQNLLSDPDYHVRRAAFHSLP